MCGPAAAPIMAASQVIGLGVSAAGAINQYNAQSADIANYNQKVYENARDAGLAASRKYGDEGFRYIFNMRDLQQQGYKAEMEARKASGTTIASAGSSGVSGSSLSVESILSDIDQQKAENLSRIVTKQDDQKQSFINNTKSIEAEAKSRINSMQPKAGPSALALGINIASSALNAGEKIAGMKF